MKAGCRRSTTYVDLLTDDEEINNNMSSWEFNLITDSIRLSHVITHVLIGFAHLVELLIPSAWRFQQQQGRLNPNESRKGIWCSQINLRQSMKGSDDVSASTRCTTTASLVRHVVAFSWSNHERASHNKTQWVSHETRFVAIYLLSFFMSMEK